MKRLYSIIAALSFTSAAFATIHHTDFGPQGLRISVDQALEMDFNNDGIMDFTFCDVGMGLSITPALVQGCIAADSAHQIFDAQLNHFGYVPKTFTGYIGDGEPWHEGGPLPIWRANYGGGLLDWSDGLPHYMGLLLMQTQSYGWLRISYDEITMELVIYEYAWDDSGSAILAGDRGISTNINELELPSVSTYPNPAQDVVNVALNNMPDQVNLEVIDAAGRVIYRKTLNNGLEATHQLNTSGWEAGQYFLRLQAGEVLLRERVIVTR